MSDERARRRTAQVRHGGPLPVSPAHGRGGLRAVVAGLFLAALTAVMLLVGVPPAQAASATPSIDPDKADQTIQVWVRKLPDRSNVPDVQVKVTGKDLTETLSTGKDGKVEVGLPTPGAYRVQVVTSSIKDFKGTVPLNPRTVQVDAGNKQVPAYFVLRAETGGTQPTSSASSSPGTAGNTNSNNRTESGGPSLIEQILPRLATGTIFGLLLALAAIGVSLIYGTTGLNNFAHGELVTFGGLVGYSFSTLLDLPPVVGLIAAPVLGGLFGYVQDLGLWSPLRRRGVGLVPLMIVSIGLSLALRYVFEFLFGPDQLTLPTDNRAALVLGPVRLRASDMLSAAACIVLLLLVAFVLLRTRMGKAMRAVADNRALAAATGINVDRIVRLVWVGGGALAGLAGVLIGYYQSLRWDTGASILLLIFAAVTLGGFGTAFGALVGSLVIGLITDLSTVFIPSNMKYVAALAVMIVILLVRPQGILGKRSRIG
jgi:branched-subunit amino acid ABC-type transport system permease component